MMNVAAPEHKKAVTALMREGLGVCAISRKLGIPLSSAHKVVIRLQGPLFRKAIALRTRRTRD